MTSTFILAYVNMACKNHFNVVIMEVRYYWQIQTWESIAISGKDMIVSIHPILHPLVPKLRLTWSARVYRTKFNSHGQYLVTFLNTNLYFTLIVSTTFDDVIKPRQRKAARSPRVSACVSSLRLLHLSLCMHLTGHHQTYNSHNLTACILILVDIGIGN